MSEVSAWATDRWVARWSTTNSRRSCASVAATHTRQSLTPATWKTERTPGSSRTTRVKSSISSRWWTVSRTATIACSGRPSAARSTSAWKPFSTPVRRSARTRCRQVDGAMPRRSARRLFGMRASSVSASRMARSVSSRAAGCRSFGTGASVAICDESSHDLCGLCEISFGVRLAWPHSGTLFGMSTRTEAPPRADIRDSILDTVGDTPLVRLSRLCPGVATPLVAKVESFNPGGSIKDRVAISLIEAAERNGRLRPGGTIVEPTSGNTGTGLAVAARLKGYRVIAVMPDKMSREKIDLLRAYGAEVVVAPTNVAPESPESYYRVAERLAAEIPGAFQPNQYFNPANPAAHYASTGPEIWEQTGGRVTHLVAGVGTGGTITGTGRYLKERNPDLVVVGADPVGSIYSGGEENVKPYLVEGVGEDFWPRTFDPAIVDRWITVSDRESFLMTRRLAQVEGILAGGSGGTALVAAVRIAREVDDPDALVTVILPDGGRSYLSKIWSEQWMTENGFIERPADQTVGDVLRAKRESGEMPPLVTVGTHQKVRHAVALLHEHRVSQLPVVSASDASSIVGSVGERGLLRHAVSDAALLDADIVDVMEPPFPAVAATDPVREAVELLVGDRQALLVSEHGRAAGILTRADLLEALAR